MFPDIVDRMCGISSGQYNDVKLNQSSDILQHSQNRPRRQMVKILKYDNPDHKIKLKIRQFQVMGKSTGQINNIGYKQYIGS